MRFVPYGRLEPRPVTPRRLAAARRAIQRQKDKIALLLPVLPDDFGTPEERVESFDRQLAINEQAWRDSRARMWRKGRRKLRELPDWELRFLVGAWDNSPYHHEAAVFSDFMTNYLRAFERPVRRLLAEIAWEQADERKKNDLGHRLLWLDSPRRWKPDSLWGPQDSEEWKPLLLFTIEELVLRVSIEAFTPVACKWPQFG